VQAQYPSKYKWIKLVWVGGSARLGKKGRGQQLVCRGIPVGKES
jgi:hypothetical protein